MTVKIIQVTAQKDGQYGFLLEIPGINPTTIVIPIAQLQDDKGKFLDKNAILALVIAQTKTSLADSVIAPNLLIGEQFDL